MDHRGIQRSKDTHGKEKKNKHRETNNGYRVFFKTVKKIRFPETVNKSYHYLPAILIFGFTNP